MDELLEGDARAEIASRYSWPHVADILEDSREHIRKKKLRFMHVLHERPLLYPDPDHER